VGSVGKESEGTDRGRLGPAGARSQGISTLPVGVCHGNCTQALLCLRLPRRLVLRCLRQGQEIYCDCSKGCDLQEAIDSAEDGDVVVVAPGECLIRAPLDFNRLHHPSDPSSPPVKNIQVIAEKDGETTLRNDAGLYTQLVIFQHGESKESWLRGFLLQGAGIHTIRGIYVTGSSARASSAA